jgi:hypothetical protein
MMEDIDSNIKKRSIKERSIVDDIDEMNQANIDDFFGKRRKNADGGLAKILEV